MVNIIKKIATLILNKEISDMHSCIDKCNLQKNVLQTKIENMIKSDRLADYYNSKYPTQDITYNRTDKLGTIKIDVRQFIQPNNFKLPEFTGTDDEIALKSLKYVISKLKYTPDKTKYGMNEYWAFPYETMKYKKDDCEGGSCLLASILIHNKIPSWKVRVSAGWVTNPSNNKKEGHAYCTYYSVKSDKWVILDWCFFKNLLNIKDRKNYKDNKLYGEIWFSFNNEGSWGNTEDIRKSKVKNILK